MTGVAQGAVLKVSKFGGTITTLASMQNVPNSIAVYGADAYWTNRVGGSVMRVPTGGGTATPLVPTGQTQAAGIAVDANFVYWATHVASVGTIAKSPLGGGGFSNIGTNLDYPAVIAIDATHVYFTRPVANGSVSKVALGGVVPVDIATAQAQPNGLAVDSTHVYWTTQTGGQVRKAPIGGGAQVTLTQNQAAPVGGHVDSTHFYWVNSGSTASDGTVMRIPIAGGSPAEQLAAGQHKPNWIAGDAKAVYWVNSGDGTVMKVAK